MTGRELKRYRMIAGFTAREFAEHINMSTSYVYSLENYFDAEIPPRREEDFIDFTGQSVFAKAKRIYELEIETKARKAKEDAERKKRKEEEKAEQEEQDRIMRQEQLVQKKIQRDAELAEQIKIMESQNGYSSMDNSDNSDETAGETAADLTNETNNDEENDEESTQSA
jgi:transcriptional regulator with XRE-family HTH domain